MSNILRVSFGNLTQIESKPLYQYDYGQILKFIGLTLPVNYEVHFSNYKKGTSITQIGNVNGVAIPDSLLTKGLPVYAWLYLHTGLSDGETEYLVTIPVIERAAISNDEPTPEQQSVITQTIAALNSAANSISSNLAESQLAVRDAGAARDGAQAYMQTTERYKNQIETAIGDGYITLGSTRLTENQLIQLLALIE